MGCNMRCKHCGSSCKTPLPGELTTDEALKLCDDLADLGLKWVTVSGGEALTRSDWHLIVKRLKDNGITPHIITNGWLLNENIIKTVEDIGIGTFAMSLDGVKETHDFMRIPGSFDRIMNALDLLKGTNLTTAIITTINNQNINELESIKEILVNKGVELWQIQIGLPMGNFANENNLLLKPVQIDDIIDFAYSTIDDERITVYLADCLGYYNLKEAAVRKKTYKLANLHWQGCSAGKQNIGILHNGDIVGCASVRDKQFIEGNIRNTPLKEIWNGENSFSWSRNMTKSKLGGLCKKCAYGDSCLGGCPNTRLTMNNSIYSENEYCSYNVAMHKSKEKISKMDNPSKLFKLGASFAEKGNLQLAEMLMARALELEPENIDLLNYYAYLNYMLGDFEEAKQVNEKILAMHPDNVYTNNGMGLTLVQLGDTAAGIEYLKKSTNLSTPDFMDPYHDLALTLIQIGRRDEAISIIEEGINKCPAFKNMINDLYLMLSEYSA